MVSSSLTQNAIYGPHAIKDEAIWCPVSTMPRFRDIESTDPNPRIELASAHWHMPDAILKSTRLGTADPYQRLHSSPIRTLNQRGLESLVPEHVLKGTVPDAGHVVKSTDFFRPSKNDRRRSPVAPKTPMSKPMPVYTNVIPSSKLEGSKRPLLVVSHPLLGVALSKRNPDQNSHGISRNVLGGFYTS